MVTIITVVTALIGAIALFFQFKRDKDINQATFIFEYGKYFNELPGVPEFLSKLEAYRKGDKKALTDDSYDGMVNYLQWCESLSILIQKGVMDFETVDNLYSYNFFLIANNEYVQNKELVPEAEYYKGVYYLHKLWTNFKRKTKQQIMMEETSLEKVSCYDEIIKKGDLFDKKHH